MARTDPRQLTWSEAQGSRTAQYQNNYLLQQMTKLCATVQSLGKQMQDVQNLGKQMQGGFAAERIRRQEDYNNKEKTMSAKMEEGFQEQTTGQTAGPKRDMQGLKNEENARQMVQKDLKVLKEETKNLNIGNGSTVCREASTGVGLGASGTFARPTALASRYNEIFIPRKMELKGWITDYKRCSFQDSRPTRS